MAYMTPKSADESTTDQDLIAQLAEISEQASVRKKNPAALELAEEISLLQVICGHAIYSEGYTVPALLRKSLFVAYISTWGFLVIGSLVLIAHEYLWARHRRRIKITKSNLKTIDTYSQRL
jgi:hypothetical protein